MYEPATVKLSRKVLVERTGLSVPTVTGALRLLRERGYIESTPNTRTDLRNKSKRFAATEYTLMDPTRLTLKSTKIEPYRDTSPQPRSLTNHGGNLLFNNGVGYFTFPSVLIEEPQQAWSMSKMTSSELLAYVGCLYVSNHEKRFDFTVPQAKLVRLSGKDIRTLRDALDDLEEGGLVWYSIPSQQKDSYRIEICDPYTARPLHTPDADELAEPSNYYTEDAKGISSRLVLNTSMTPDTVERIILSLLNGGTYTRQGNGNLTVTCPFHQDHTPSLSVSPSRGIWQCFGCGEKGHLQKLVSKLEQDRGTKGETFHQAAIAQGKHANFHRPDDTAVTYRYRDEKGNVLKEVLRYPDEDGKKVFSQRQPLGKGKYRWNIKGLPPLLYNLDLLQNYVNTVAIVEGEKDALALTQLELNNHCLVAVTSGGAKSWHPTLAKHLKYRRVILMPDDDKAVEDPDEPTPGEQFAKSVRDSLDAEGIEYRQISFAGTGAKDASEYLASHTVEDLVRLMGIDWVRMPDGTTLEDNSPEAVALRMYWAENPITQSDIVI